MKVYYAVAPLFRNLLGDTPVIFLNTLSKLITLLKPQL